MKHKSPILAAAALSLAGLAVLLWQAATQGEATSTHLARPAPVQVTTL